MFLDDIRNVLCHHPNECFGKLHNSSLIACNQCGHQLDAYAFILNQSEDPFASMRLAHSFATWTGDIHVPCTFPLTQIPGIYPKRVVTNLATLLNTLKLLKLINSPFIPNSGISSSSSSTTVVEVPKGLFQQFMAEYMHLIDRLVHDNEKDTCSSSSHSFKEEDEKENRNEYLALQAILTNMKNAFADVDLFEQYFKMLVPYVKMCTNIDTLSGDDDIIHCGDDEEDENHNNIGYHFYVQMIRSIKIRQRFSPYCILFDVVHVMVLCFICGHDSDAVANIVFDLSARLCKGYFSNTYEPLTQHIMKFLNTHITRTQHLDLYYFIRNIKKGETEAHFSEKFIKEFSQLDDMLRNVVLSSTTTQENEEDKNTLQKFAYQQAFPYILFSNQADYFGFVLAMAHYASKTNNGRCSSNNNVKKGGVEKGTLKTSREIYRFVKTLMERIRLFDREGEEIMWTRDTFNLFLCSDSGFEKEFGNILNLMMQDYSSGSSSSSSNDNNL